MTIFESIYRKGLEVPYTTAFNELNMALLGANKEGVKITLQQRGIHAAKGAILLVPLVNILALCVFRAIDSYFKADGPRTLGKGGAAPSGRRNLALMNVTAVRLRGETVVETDDLIIAVRTTKADDNKHYAELTITPSNFADEAAENRAMDFVFCIDVSSSMDRKNRLDQVKVMLKDFLDKAEAALQEDIPSKIGFSIVCFNETATVKQEVVVLTPNNIAGIKNTIDSMKAGGRTNIVAGFTEAARKMKDMQKIHHVASRTLVFLTDGEDPDMNDDQLREPQQTLMRANGNIYALGIGREHRAEVMQRVIGNHLAADARGNYPNAVYEWIDQYAKGPMMKGQTTLAASMQAIFAQATVSWVQNVKVKPLTQTADVIMLNTMKDDDNAFVLGGIPFGSTLSKVIQVIGNEERLEFSVDYEVRGESKKKNFTVTLGDEENRAVFVEFVRQEVATIFGEIAAISDWYQKSARVEEAIDKARDAGLNDLIEQLEEFKEAMGQRGVEWSSRAFSSYGAAMMSNF